MLRKLQKKSLWPISPWSVFEGEEEGGEAGGGGATLLEKPTAGEEGGEIKTVLNEPVSPVRADGSFIDNWRDMLPDDLKGEKCLETVTDFPNAIKQLVSHKKMIGKNKVALPADDAPQEEWDQFYGAIRGQNIKVADDYKLEVPEELADIYDGETLKQAKELAFSLGANQRQFEAYMKHDMARAAQLIAEQEKFESDAETKEYDDARALLRKEWGLKYEENMHAANKFITHLAPNQESMDRVIRKVGNDPDFIMMMYRGGARMKESGALVGQPESSTRTPSEAQARINELQATKGYMGYDGTLTTEQRDSITREIRELYKQIELAKKAV